MQHIQLGLLIPDGITRGGVEGLIKENGYANYDVFVFEEFTSVLKQARKLQMLLMDTSKLQIGKIENRIVRLTTCCPALKIMIISTQLKVQHIQGLMQLGVKGYIYRDDLSDSLMTSLDLVSRDVISVSARPLQLLTNADQLYTSNDLRPIDRQILRLTADGLTVKVIAHTLCVSQRSVYRSRDRLREVLGVTNNETLIDTARERGLLDDDEQ